MKRSWTAKKVWIAVAVVLVGMLIVGSFTLFIGGTAEDVGAALVMMAGFALLIAFRLFFGTIIATAAMRRNCGYNGWRISSLIFGPLYVWIVYLIFVHWRYAGDITQPSEEPETEQPA